MEEEYAKDYSTGELMAAVMSRNILDGEVGAVGANSVIPKAACRLAQLTHAPNMWWLCGPVGAVNPKVNRLVKAVTDYRNYEGAEARISLGRTVDFEYSGKWDFAFFGGFQIDKWGNVNMAYIGEQRKPKFRGPGTVGIIFTASAKRIFLYVHNHDKRLFVENVDFVSGPGYLNGGNARDVIGIGPRSQIHSVVTPMACFDFEDSERMMRLKSVHPGHTVEEVLSKMSFEPMIPKNVPSTKPPTVNEMAILRFIDPDSHLQNIIH